MREQDSIPKIIHYCWFGGNPLSEMAEKCIRSWKRFCPDYEIIQWNETNFDVNCCRYAKEAYQAGKWAFVSDVARLYALVELGGVYLEGGLRTNSSFLGWESETKIGTALMASVKEHAFFVELLNDYDGESFLKSDGSWNTTTNVTRITTALEKYGLVSGNSLQIVRDVTVYPTEFFCPKDFVSGQIWITENTYAIHHYEASWWTQEQKYAAGRLPHLKKIFPERQAKYMAKAVAILHFRGVRGLFLEWKKRLQNDD